MWIQEKSSVELQGDICCDNVIGQRDMYNV